METFRDKTRDNICAALQRMGIDAQMVKRGRYEEGTRTGSLGLIDILEGPIRWVNVRRVSHGQYRTDYYTDYGVPDARLGHSSPKLRIHSVRVRSFPLFGRVIDLRWEGTDFHREIISRLSMEYSIKSPIMKSGDVTIEIHGIRKCWTISTMTSRAPSKELWDCYQTIAQHLLSAWLPADRIEVRTPLLGYTEEGMFLEQPTSVCPECGSSNVTKAIKRWPRSQEEIQALGFRCEWECFCINCRYNWVEREK